MSGSKLTTSQQHFYLAQRRCLTHPSTLGPEHGWKVPASFAEFKARPTAKLSVLKSLLVHHLSRDKAPPAVNKHGLETDRSKYPPWPESNQLIGVKKFKYAAYKSGPPDKIIIYSAFPSNNDVILRVSGIQNYVRSGLISNNFTGATFGQH